MSEELFRVILLITIASIAGGILVLLAEGAMKEKKPKKGKQAKAAAEAVGASGDGEKTAEQKVYEKGFKDGLQAAMDELKKKGK